MSEPAVTPISEDAAPPTSADDLLAKLDELGIAYQRHHHEPLFTVADSQAMRGQIDGAHIKNLFVKNKKGQIWMITVLEHRSVDLNTLAKQIGAGRVSFAKPELLWQYWGVRPGAVTPFGAINDSENVVTVILDEALKGEACVNCHPLVNDQTIGVSADDLVKFLTHTNHEPTFVTIPERESA
ncbi:MAG: prolyl-tRNA synthetase associated domain-containing protein [Alphaproteobacteria bacterium]|nr:prolyl-tRNA synthetase associated domain-containing protein [Alphaproteobacteria bacterium SS10]